MLPVSRRRNWGLATSGLAISVPRSDRHDLGLVLEAVGFLRLQLRLDARGVLVGHLVHPDRALGPAREELADHPIVGVPHLLLAPEALEAGAEEDAHELGRAHDRRDV